MTCCSWAEGTARGPELSGRSRTPEAWEERVARDEEKRGLGRGTGCAGRWCQGGGSRRSAEEKEMYLGSWSLSRGWAITSCNLRTNTRERPWLNNNIN